MQTYHRRIDDHSSQGPARSTIIILFFIHCYHQQAVVVPHDHGRGEVARPQRPFNQYYLEMTHIRCSLDTAQRQPGKSLENKPEPDNSAKQTEA
jgi:hypothetical protein